MCERTMPAAVQFALLTTRPALLASDILIVT